MRRISRYLTTANPLASFLARLGIFRLASSIPPERLNFATRTRSPSLSLVASGGPVSPAIQAARAAFGSVEDPLEELYADREASRVRGQDAARAQAAVATLHAKGWTWHGGVQWRPPLGLPPEEFGALGWLRLRMRVVAESFRENPPAGLVKGSPFYVAVKRPGQGTGWSYHAVALSLSDLDVLLEDPKTPRDARLD